MIYLDNSATTPILPCAREVLNTVLSVPANPNSSHYCGDAARNRVEEARKVIAKCINARPDEIYFTSGATDACQWAMETLSQNCGLTQVSAVEHHAVMDFPVRTNSDKPCKGIVQMAVNNETGEVFKMPIRGSRNDLIFTDATAAMGHICLNVNGTAKVDLLAAGAHKFGGPCGVGFLYARRGVKLAERRTGTPPVALIAAMAAALEWQRDYMEANTCKIDICADVFYETLWNKVIGWQTNSPTNRVPNILNVSFDDVDGKALALLCSKRGVMISAGAACTSGNNEPSHVLMAMYHDEQRARSAVRISFSHENTPQEAEQAAKIIAECVETLRAIS